MLFNEIDMLELRLNELWDAVLTGQYTAGYKSVKPINIQMLYQCHLRMNPEHPSQVNPRCPRDLGDVIMKLLDKQPKNRFTDCDELRIALSRVGRGRI